MLLSQVKGWGVTYTLVETTWKVAYCALTKTQRGRGSQEFTIIWMRVWGISEEEKDWCL